MGWSIELSCDIATAVSVVVSAGGIWCSQKRQLKQSRAEAQRQWRIDKMSGLVEGLLTIREKGLEVIEQVRMAQAGRQLAVTVDDYTAFCASVLRSVETVDLSFSMWATRKELDVLESIKSLVVKWNNDFITIGEQIIHDRSKSSELPQFDKLVDDFSGEIKKLSLLLKTQVENVSASV